MLPLNKYHMDDVLAPLKPLTWLEERVFEKRDLISSAIKCVAKSNVSSLVKKATSFVEKHLITYIPKQLIHSVNFVKWHEWAYVM